MNMLQRLTCANRRFWAAVALALLGLTTPTAQAGYYQWDAVTLPLASGAACGNGTPYRFFVNRAWRAKDTVFVFEGGGACWDQASCEGKGVLSATNAQGVDGDYLRSSTTAAYGLVTPFISRLNVLERVRTQGWNMVYLPYCTGDVHTGSLRRVYDDADPTAPRVQHHHGLANVRGAAAWERDLAHWKQALAPYANISWHLPFFRDFAGSHCLTLVDFSGTGIEEVGLADVNPFIDTTIDRGKTLRNEETDRLSDLTRPLGTALRRLMGVLKLFGLEA